MKHKVPRGSTVDQWEAGLRQPQRDIVKGLRRAVKRSVPSAREVVKWSWPWYEGNDLIAAIMVHDDHVNLEVARGAEITAPADCSRASARACGTSSCAPSPTSRL